ncbi:MAG: hypothetical protein BWY37_02095 [Firmicutes bacterium ADurb.Bin262]|nr:MAG: hypothetical protein BWY37_02095 [Firmicutes bacterium ADurb.Bin262]
MPSIAGAYFEPAHRRWALRQVRHLPAGADVDQYALAGVAHTAEVTGLIVADRDGDRNAAVFAEDFEAVRHLREKGVVQPRFRGGRAVKTAPVQIKKAETGGVRYMRQGNRRAGEFHRHIIVDGTENGGALRHAVVDSVVKECCPPETGGHFVTGHPAQVSGVGRIPVRFVAAFILPVVQRADRVAAAVEVDDAVHLSGYADGGNRAVFADETAGHFFAKAQDDGRVLNAFEWVNGCQRGGVRPRHAAQHLAAAGVDDGGADGSGPDIEPDDSHHITSSGRSTQGRAV